MELTDKEIMDAMPKQLHEDLAKVCQMASDSIGVDVAGMFRVCLNRGIVDHCRAAALLREAVAVDQKTKELITAVQATYSAYGWVPEKHFIRLFDDVARLASALEEGCDCSIQKPLNWETEILELKARPRPVPVAERPWERPGWCDADGRCWIGTPETEYPLGDTGDYDLIDASWSLELPPSDPALQRMQRVVSHPHWAIPQPPQGGEVET